MPTYEYTETCNIQDGPESEFEKVRREVLAKVDPGSHHCLVKRNGVPKMVRFATFSKNDEGEMLVMFHPIASYPVQAEYCKPSEVLPTKDEQPHEWPEDHLSKVGYATQTIKRLE